MKIFRLLSALLDYPTDAFLAALREAAGSDPAGFVAAEDGAGVLGTGEHATLAAFVADLLAADPAGRQAEYVQTFDLTAEHSLHLTHHLFGEEKTRGPALVDLGEFYRGYGLQADPRELPDFLPLMLEFASTLGLDEAHVFLADVAKVLAVLAANLEKSASRYAPLVRIVEQQGSLARLPV
ncbi:nitrate reductase molybdenum cofactor assembly chaperone [Pseudothauera rhizosphaerae]|uniref:Nitrate reductase molybdenum cofactor assembly chaperone n=1 Tax=Pseudothauera rhizosphaerae TaxID=2565932 RepID=A0A4S4ATP0_9RHOO|nr:nitrate reductase molybdenum cofactor assembly chaperone [Pseudothauera rhizosphaerae]THF63246.1 nitrate reductase molybdenum cofactor assembly chaperone [Pseudothauera rhizosphaerae]